MSLNFLGKKSFHPSNPKNVQKLFVAEEKKKTEEKKREELKREHELEESRRHARSLIEDNAGRPKAASSTNFMYQAPPGLKEAQERQRGIQQQQREEEKTRADREAERFAILKNAPRAGEYTKDLEVHHKPFGVALRNVKCSRCGEWGHSAGDRECSMRHVANPADEANKARDDPLQRGAAGGEASGAALRWAPKAAPEAGVHGGLSRDDASQQFVPMIDEVDELALAAANNTKQNGEGGGHEIELSDLDPAVLSMLNEKQQRRLLKMYRKEMAADGGGGGGGGVDEGGGGGGVGGGGGGSRRTGSEKRPRDEPGGAHEDEPHGDEHGRKREKKGSHHRHHKSHRRHHHHKSKKKKHHHHHGRTSTRSDDSESRSRSASRSSSSASR